MRRSGGLLYFFFNIATATIGYHKHGSTFWAIVDFFFAPIAWIKWLIYHEVNIDNDKRNFFFLFKIVTWNT